MSSYDCVLAIEERKLRRIAAQAARRARLPGDVWPIPASMLRALPTSTHSFQAFTAIRLAASVVDAVSDDSFYGRLGDRPRVLVAGAKNGFALRGLERTWRPEMQLYQCDWREPTPGSDALDLLLHGHRGIPGLPVLEESPAWPAFDGPMVLGYLLPEEVGRLDAVAGEFGDDPHARSLRRMITRAAAAQLCLATLQSGM